MVESRPVPRSLRERLERLIADHSLSATDVAKAAGMARQTIRNVLNGKSVRPSTARELEQVVAQLEAEAEAKGTVHSIRRTRDDEPNHVTMHIARGIRVVLEDDADPEALAQILAFHRAHRQRGER